MKFHFATLVVALVFVLSVPVLGGAWVATAQPSGSNGEIRAWFRTFAGANLFVANDQAAFMINQPDRRIHFFFDGQTVLASDSLAVVVGWGCAKEVTLPDGTVLDGACPHIHDMQDFRDDITHTLLIDGIDLGDLTMQQKTPVRFDPHDRPVIGGGVVNGAFFFTEGGTFKPCELLDLIGPGGHELRSIFDASDFFFDIPSTFFLDPGTC